MFASTAPTQTDALAKVMRVAAFAGIRSTSVLCQNNRISSLQIARDDYYY